MIFYMHKNAMDVCIEVLKIRYQDDRQIKLKVRWWNLGYAGERYALFGNNAENLILSRANWLEWVNITDQVDNKREKPGLPPGEL
jgi:hypothetical protein